MWFFEIVAIILQCDQGRIVYERELWVFTLVILVFFDSL